jgi:hypothetical protein
MFRRKVYEPHADGISAFRLCPHLRINMSFLRTNYARIHIPQAAGIRNPSMTGHPRDLTFGRN